MKVLLSAGLLGLAWLAAINAVLTLLAWLTAYGVLRRTEPVPGAGVLVTRENANPGWEATQGGRPLASVVVDGWQQGWLVDGGPEPVRATFAPDRGFRLYRRPLVRGCLKTSATGMVRPDNTSPKSR